MGTKIVHPVEKRLIFGLMVKIRVRLVVVVVVVRVRVNLKEINISI